MKLLVVNTGGTIACSRIAGVLSPNAENSPALIQMYKAADPSVEFETVQPFFILSENLSAQRLEQLFDCVSGRLGSGYDGVIVTHGTDTLQFSAAYLGLKLGLCQTPVVFVSANYPLSDKRSNGFYNFRAAVELIKTGRACGVFAAYRNPGERTKLHRGTSLLPFLPLSDRLCSLFDCEYATERDGKIEMNPGFAEQRFPDLSGAAFSGAVLWLRAHPGMALPSEINAKAVLIEGYHSGTLNTACPGLRAFCLSAAQRKIPVYLVGSQGGFEYESKSTFEQMGLKVLEPMSPVTAYMLIWLAV